MNNQMMNMLNQLRQNPMQILSKRFNLPQNLPNNPQEIIQHLLNTGQISQGQVNNAMQMKKQFFGN
jgi:ferritin